jgi:uncharacterized protein YlxW (UPF0749 family)
MDFATVSAVAAPLLALALGWLLSSKKSDAEIRKLKAEAIGLEIENADAVVAFWKKMSEDLTNEMQELKAEVIGLRAENKTLNQEIKKLERIIHQNMKQ